MAAPNDDARSVRDLDDWQPSARVDDKPATSSHLVPVSVRSRSGEGGGRGSAASSRGGVPVPPLHHQTFGNAPSDGQDVGRLAFRGGIPSSSLRHNHASNYDSSSVFGTARLASGRHGGDMMGPATHGPTSTRHRRKVGAPSRRGMGDEKPPLMGGRNGQQPDPRTQPTLGAGPAPAGGPGGIMSGSQSRRGGGLGNAGRSIAGGGGGLAKSQSESMLSHRSGMSTMSRHSRRSGRGSMASQRSAGLASQRSASSSVLGMSTRSSAAKTGRTHGRGRKVFPSHDHDEDVVLQEVKLPSEMPISEREVVRVQRHVLRNVQAHASDKNHESKIMVRAFRMCKPDEFGLVSRDRFRTGMKEQFRLSNRQADMLFNLVDQNGSEEIHYAKFRNAFDSLEDRHIAPPQQRRHKHTVIGHEQGPAEETGELFKGKVVSLASLAQGEKQKYRDYQAIRKLIGMEKRDMKQAFNTRLESEGNVRTLTQLSYNDVSRVLQSKGVEIAPDRLRALIPSAPAAGAAAFDPEARSGDRITFSQLNRATHDFFADLDGVGPSQVDQRGQKMEFRGRFVGCRKVGEGPASKAHTSAKDFLAHHDKPHQLLGGPHETPLGRRARDGTYRSPTSLSGATGGASSSVAGAGEQQPDWHVASHNNNWKHRWTDKKVEQPKPGAKKMLQYSTNDGHGDVIGWRGSNAAGPHVHEDKSTIFRASALRNAGGSMMSGRGSLAAFGGSDRDTTRRGGKGGMGNRTQRSQAPFATGRNWDS